MIRYSFPSNRKLTAAVVSFCIYNNNIANICLEDRIKQNGKFNPVLNSLNATAQGRMWEWRWTSTLLNLLTSFMSLTLYYNGAHWIGGSVGSRTGPDALQKTEIQSPVFDRPAVKYSVAICLCHEYISLTHSLGMH
jgi:hypothetical protein